MLTLTNKNILEKVVKKMLKNLKKVLVMTATTVLVLAGCGGNTAPTDGPVELRISWWGGDSRHTATLEAIELFQEKTGITVKSEYGGFSGHQEKLTTQIAGNTEPDVMQLNWNWIVSFSPDGTGFYDLNELNDTVQLNNFDSTMLETGTVNGKLNGIPVSTTGRALFLNKTTYEKFGVALPKTWDDVFAAAEKFDDGYYPMDLDNGSAATGFLMMTTWLQQQTGRGFINENKEIGYTRDELISGYKFYEELVAKGVAPSISERSGEGGTTELFEMPNWIDGKYAGVYEWSSSVSKYAGPLTETNQELVLADIPTVNNPVASGIISKPSLMWGISSKTKHPKEAAMLLDFLLNDPEAASILALERGVPNSIAALEVLESEGKLSGLEYTGTQFVVENSDVPLSPYFEDAELRSIYQSVMEKLGYGQITAEQAADELIDSVTRRLNAI